MIASSGSSVVRGFVGLGVLCVSCLSVSALDVVKGGQGVAVIVVDQPPMPASGPSVKVKKGAVKKGAANFEQQAAQVLQEWVKKMTDVELPIRDKPVAGQAALYVGQSAVKAGLKLDDISSPSQEGLRIVVEADRALIAGQSDQATLKAVARFLEEFGCRYFMDSPLGEVYPRTKDLSLSNRTLTEKPALMYRNPKGPSWSSELWKRWNGAGGQPFAHSHSWGGYLPAGLFEKHPEWFAMGPDGQRRNGDWICTSNPELRAFFAEQVIARVKAGEKHPSISPTDGRGYCQCPACKAQDDPKIIEPSSGTVAVSNRYADFFDDIGRRVAKECPEAILSFYVYADYTQVPRLGDRQLSPNLVAMIAPIRYCRLHALGDPNCPSRHQQLELIDGWGKLASRLGYYNYMYNLADATLPMFKFTPCKVEFPYLADKGLTYMTIEILSNWYIYGPQIYLSTRMAYDPKLNADAVMEDYFTKFYGPAAEPMKAYWLGIDEAVKNLRCHSGGFFGLASAYTPEFIRVCQSRLAQAAERAQGDAVYAERVAMHAAGFQNVIDYKAIEDALAKGDFPQARQIFDAMIRRIDGLVAKQQANREYGTSYLNRFLSKIIDGGLEATRAPNQVLSVLPDRWKFALDKADEGEAQGYARPDFNDSGWKDVATYSATLSAQGQESGGVLWYRQRLTIPAGMSGRPLALLFSEVDGRSVSVYVNGQAVEPETTLKPVAKKGAKTSPAATPKTTTTVPRRVPFTVKLDGLVKEGDNSIVVKCDNRAISELYLGGIIRPVLLIQRAANP